MNAPRRALVAAIFFGVSVLLSRDAAAQDDEIVVYGKRPPAGRVQLDAAAVRIDVERNRERLRAALEAAAAGKAAPPSRVAATAGRPRG